MFTGLIEALGEVETRDGSRLVVGLGNTSLGDLSLGESIAVNGACLTLVPGYSSNRLLFDVSPETFARTSLGGLAAGKTVNIERAVKANDRLGGHIVQGHVDATGRFLSRKDESEFSVFEFQAPGEYDRYLIDKGSVAIDGVSLTVVRPRAGTFTVALIPATLEKTNLGKVSPGDVVNLEFDLIAKYVEKLMGSAKPAAELEIDGGPR